MQSHKLGRVASLIGVEGGHSIGTSLGVLRMFYQLGARYLTITHTCNTLWADCCLVDEPGRVPHIGGLSHFGTVRKDKAHYHFNSESHCDSFGRLAGSVIYRPQLVIKEMNRLGMMVDLSHVSVPTMIDALSHSKAPVIFSHSAAHAICNRFVSLPGRDDCSATTSISICNSFSASSRNVPDHVLKRIVSRGWRKKRAKSRQTNARLGN